MNYDDDASFSDIKASCELSLPLQVPRVETVDISHYADFNYLIINSHFFVAPLFVVVENAGMNTFEETLSWRFDAVQIY